VVLADVLGRRTFVGRSRELARLRDALASTVAGNGGRVVVIGGEAGIGKSSLAARFAVAVQPAVHVLAGSCLEAAEEALPYAPFVEILRTIVREMPDGRLPAVLGPGRAELTRLLPELATRTADLGPPVELDRASQARLFELLLGLFERIAKERALVLLIEDLQWADRSTRDLIDFLSHGLREDRILLVFTTRTDDAGDAIGNLAFLAELERGDDVDRIELRPFDREEVAEQAASLLADAPGPGVVDRLLARSDGNPFHVEELILANAGGSGPLPPVLRDVVRARVGRLSAAARDIVRAAAVGGRRIDDELIAGALGVPVRDVAPGLREAVASGVLAPVDSPDGQAFEFRHALLHEVVDRELFPGERVALHAAFAEALQRRLAGGDRRVTAIEIARHWDGAHQPSRALPFMVHAAEGAEAVHAFAEAQRLWERAAAIVDEQAAEPVDGRDLVEMLDRAAECAALVGAPGQAAVLVQRALERIPPGAVPTRVLLLQNRLRWYRWWSGERAAALAAVEHALVELGPDRTVDRARVLAQQAGIRLLAGDFGASAASAREAIDIGVGANEINDIALAYGVLGFDLAVLGDVDAGIAEFRRGQEIAEAVGSVEGMAIGATNLAALLDRVGRSEASLEAATAGYATTERLGVARTFGTVLLALAAKAELALGRWDDADRTTAMALRRGAFDAPAVLLQVVRARLLVGRGEFAEAANLLERARAGDTRLGGTDYRTALLAAEAELAAWTGSLPDALRLAEEGLAAVAASGSPDPSLAWLAALVLRAIADARPIASRDVADRARRVVGAIGSAIDAAAATPGFATGARPEALLALLRAEQDRVAGRHEPGRWRDVAERWAAIGRPFQVAYARLRECEAILASRGPRSTAAAVLGEAAAGARRLGAAPLAERIERLARQARISLPSAAGAAAAASASASDGAPTTAGTSGGGDDNPFDLTARESEVLRLVAAGWTNLQIADALVITRKTASVHVSNVMGKLGAANRGEAAALAHRLGLVDDAPLPIGLG
jgi:DNA-binding CsgD family transcriptional regulator/tetratricopeptide (TPR) repeat protein